MSVAGAHGLEYKATSFSRTRRGTDRGSPRVAVNKLEALLDVGLELLHGALDALGLELGHLRGTKVQLVENENPGTHGYRVGSLTRRSVDSKVRAPGKRRLIMVLGYGKTRIPCDTAPTQCYRGISTALWFYATLHHIARTTREPTLDVPCQRGGCA